MMEFLLKVGASYLLGSLIGSLIVGALRGGVDIRALGSGNAGGTNALRTQGKRFAFWVMLIDVGKGFIATRLLAPVAIPGIPPAGPPLSEWISAACGFAVMVGHVLPLWYGFRGGKGVATLIGAVLGLEPWLLLPVLAVWIVMLMLFGFVGLASISAAISLPVAIAMSDPEPRLPLLAFGVACALLVVITHRGNVARMIARTETRARRAWLFGGRRVAPRDDV
jgi:glycerol-3-phosphate acyltransferase PlsY